jgi:MFS family permease
MAGTFIKVRTPLLSAYAAMGVFWGSWGALLPAVKEHVHISAPDLGLALAAIPVGAIPSMVLIGRLARGRERGALIATAVAFASSIAALAPASSPTALVLSLLAVGAASGAYDVCINMATARAERETGLRLFQPAHAAFPVAVIVAAPTAGLARQLGFATSAVLLVIALIVLAVGLTALLLPVERKPPTREGPEVRRRTDWRTGVILGALAAAVLVIENSVEQWSALLLEDHRSASPVLAAAGPATYMAAQIVGRVLAQWAPWLRTRAIIALAGSGAGVGIVLAGLAPTAWATLLGLGVAGLLAAPLIPGLLEYAGERDPSGGLVPMVTTIYYAGFVVSPMLVGTLTVWVGLPVALACLGLLALPVVAASRSPLFTLQTQEPFEKLAEGSPPSCSGA